MRKDVRRKNERRRKKLNSYEERERRGMKGLREKMIKEEKIKLKEKIT